MSTKPGRWRSSFRVGDRTVLGVSDGSFTMREGFMNVPGFQHQFEDADGVAALPIASFVVPGDQTVLLDTGVGPVQLGTLSGGALPGELEAIGVPADDIDIVAISHLHLDHDGWLANEDAEPIFANATVYVGRGDYEWFVMADEEVPPRFRMASHLRTALVDLFAAGRVVLVDDTTEIAPGIVALATPGHTPGHLMFSVRDGGEQLLVLGDAMYCPAQLTDADLTAMHDVDPVLARRSRELIQRELEAHGSSAVGCHFPGLEAARVLDGKAQPVHA
jgi:glyoxylase-like metal-dependent hydrolase (beta-lactamase superfamily II)